MTSANAKPNSGSILAAFWRYSAGQRHWIAVGGLLVTVTVTFVVGLPLYYRYLLDEAVVKNDINLLMLMLIWLAAAYFINSSAALLQSKVFARLSAAISRHLRLQMFNHVQAQTDRNRDSASIANHFSADLAAVEKWLAQPARVMLIHASVLIASALLLFWVEWRLALFTYAIIPIIALAMKLLSKPTNHYSELKKNTDAEIATFITEEVRISTMLHLFGLKNERRQQFLQHSNTMWQYEQKSAFWSSATGETSIILVNLIQIGIFGLGAWFAISGYITIGILIAYAGLMINISNAGITLSQLAPQLFDASAAYNRIHQLLQVDNQPAVAHALQQLRQIESICFEQVEFGYTPQQTILRKIDLSIQRGEHVALVGSSGSGKSTLLKLLMGLEHCRHGRLKYNQTPMEQIDITALHRLMATVFQEPLLLNRSIADNIRCGKPDASDDEVKEAARQAGIDEMIQQMEQGYLTLVGETGGKLSGGQQQRIAIARALVRQPQVLILDEATSALDATTEQAFIGILQKNSRQRTVIAVTHRLSLATAMDRIIVLHQGEIIEDGSHAELQKQNGFYARLWQKQSIAHTNSQGELAVNIEQVLALPPLAALNFDEILTADELTALAARFTQQHYPVNEVIFSEGQQPDAFRIIARGRVEIYRTTPTETTLALLEEGDYFGEGALLHQTTRMASVRAKEDTLCLALSSADFDAVIRQHPELEQNLNTQFQQRLTANSHL